MKYRRSWLPPRIGRVAVDLSGARPGKISRTRLNPLEKRIDEIETPIEVPHHQELRRERSKSPGITDLKWSLLAAGALFLGISGCTISTTSHGWPGSYAPAGVPNAQNCVPFSFGQPTEFACPGGKVYKAAQLKELREQTATGGTVASAGH